VETFLRATSGRTGYGGLDLHRRKFGLSHAYTQKCIERKDKPFGFHPQPEVWGLPANRVKLLVSRRGVSPVLAVLLLIVIAVGAAVVTYAWVMTFTSTQTGHAGGVLVRENVRFYGSPADAKNRTDITIRNTGISDAKVAAVYWSNSSFASLQKLTATDYTMIPETGIVSPGSSITITLSRGWASGTTYYFKVVTEAGTYLEFTARAP
jgi:flagellin-like protein